VRLYVVNDSEIQISGKTLKKGEILVNNRPIESYFPGEIYKKLYLEPFRTTNTIGRFAVSAKISGGGLSGQLGAFIHGVSRALVKVDEEKLRPILKKRGFLTRDSRIKERRKAGFAQKARAKKQSPKR
jgi:small subunit ribosomal protein S9